MSGLSDLSDPFPSDDEPLSPSMVSGFGGVQNQQEDEKNIHDITSEQEVEDNKKTETEENVQNGDNPLPLEQRNTPRSVSCDVFESSCTKGSR